MSFIQSDVLTKKKRNEVNRFSFSLSIALFFFFASFVSVTTTLMPSRACIHIRYLILKQRTHSLIFSSLLFSVDRGARNRNVDNIYIKAKKQNARQGVDIYLVCVCFVIPMQDDE